MRFSDWMSDVCSSDLDAGADRHRGERGPADGVAFGPAQGARDEVAEQVGKQADRERQRARLQCPQPAGVQRKVHSPGTTLRAAASRLPSAPRRTEAATSPSSARSRSTHGLTLPTAARAVAPARHGVYVWPWVRSTTWATT